jgi:hypothetical protein
MTATKNYDWASVDTLAGMAEWLRAESGALCVLVIRRDDGALVTDAGLAPGDVLDLIEEHAPSLVDDLRTAPAPRGQPRVARYELGELRE